MFLNNSKPGENLRVVHYWEENLKVDPVNFLVSTYCLKWLTWEHEGPEILVWYLQ